MKKYLPIFILLIVCLSAFLWVQENKSQELPGYTLSLPENFVFRQDNKTRKGEILLEDQVVGGVLKCIYSQEIVNSQEPAQINSQTFSVYSDVIMTTLQAADAPGAEPSAFDRMMDSSPYADCQIWFGNQTQEYRHYLFFSENGILDLWFDLSQVEINAADDIAANLSIA